MPGLARADTNTNDTKLTLIQKITITLSYFLLSAFLKVFKKSYDECLVSWQGHVCFGQSISTIMAHCDW